MLAKVRIPPSYLQDDFCYGGHYIAPDEAWYLNRQMVKMQGKIIKVRQFPLGSYSWEGGIEHSTRDWCWKRDWLDFDLTPEEVEKHAR